MTNAKDQYSLGILPISDAGSKGKREDNSGDAIVEIMTDLGFRLALRDIVPDEPDLISERLRDWCDGGEVDVVLTRYTARRYIPVTKRFSFWDSTFLR